jgi:hypothetical protein
MNSEGAPTSAPPLRVSGEMEAFADRPRQTDACLTV